VLTAIAAEMTRERAGNRASMLVRTLARTGAADSGTEADARAHAALRNPLIIAHILSFLPLPALCAAAGASRAFALGSCLARSHVAVLLPLALRGFGPEPSGYDWSLPIDQAAVAADDGSDDDGSSGYDDGVSSENAKSHVSTAATAAALLSPREDESEYSSASGTDDRDGDGDCDGAGVGPGAGAGAGASVGTRLAHDSNSVGRRARASARKQGRAGASRPGAGPGLGHGYGHGGDDDDGEDAVSGGIRGGRPATALGDETAIDPVTLRPVVLPRATGAADAAAAAAAAATAAAVASPRGCRPARCVPTVRGRCWKVILGSDGSVAAILVALGHAPAAPAAATLTTNTNAAAGAGAGAEAGAGAGTGNGVGAPATAHARVQNACYLRLTRAPTPASTALLIAKDVPRTLLHLRAFASPAAAHAALARLLHAYALVDPGVTYCQGMNFIAGNLLTQLDEPSALWALFAMLNATQRATNAAAPGVRAQDAEADAEDTEAEAGSEGPVLARTLSFALYAGGPAPDSGVTGGVPRCDRFASAGALPDLSLRVLYMPTLAGMRVARFVFNELLRERMPALFAHFVNESLPIDILTEWFMTLFAFPSFPAPTTLRLWDWLLVAGAPALFRAALAALTLLEPHLLRLGFEGMYALLKKRARRSLFRPDRLLHVAQTHPLTQADLLSLQAAAVAHIATHGNILPGWPH